MRMCFAKTGNARFMSHLDLMRCMTRTLTRANVPIWYTQGFNPHPYLVFSSPLSLGVASRCELLDIKLDGEVSYDRLKIKLNSSSPDGIDFLRLYDTNTSFSDIAFADYRLVFSNALTGRFTEFLGNDIVVEKKTKSGMKEINLKNELCDLQLSFEGENTVAEIMLPCGNEKNVGVTLFTDAFNAYVGDIAVTETVRTAFLDKNKAIFV